MTRVRLGRCKISLCLCSSLCGVSSFLLMNCVRVFEWDLRERAIRLRERSAIAINEG